MNSQPTAHPKTETATFAGGCFWCMEQPFKKLNGVKDAITGYMGGNREKNESRAKRRLS